MDITTKMTEMTPLELTNKMERERLIEEIRQVLDQTKSKLEEVDSIQRLHFIKKRCEKVLDKRKVPEYTPEAHAKYLEVSKRYRERNREKRVQATRERRRKIKNIASSMGQIPPGIKII